MSQSLGLKTVNWVGKNRSGPRQMTSLTEAILNMQEARRRYKAAQLQVLPALIESYPEAAKVARGLGLIDELAARLFCEPKFNGLRKPIEMTTKTSKPRSVDR